GLIGGGAGGHVQALANALAAEASVSAPEKRDAVLAHYAAACGADFFLFHNNGRQLAGPVIDLPAVLRRNLIMPGEPARLRPADMEFPPGDAPLPPRAEPFDAGAARARGRFYQHTENPVGQWIGLRVPFNREGEPRAPATLFVRVKSPWGLLRLLDLQPWLLAGAGVLVFSILFWLPLVWSITRSLARLTVATGEIAEGRFATRVPEQRRDEIGALGGSVNRMAARLDTLVNGQTRFLADVAHELGSPLGRLQVAIEILETRAEPALRTQVADVREEVQHMAALVNELLAFTKAGLRSRDAQLAPVALTPLVGRVLAREDPAQRVAATIPADLTVLADAEHLERALGNLVRNAFRYAPAGAITLVAHTAGATATLTVADEGPGVPADALARLGEPFFRPDAARTSEAGGTGLGLAIVKAGIAACRGTVVFRNRAPRGFEAEITLTPV
ncbi:MAG: HAMP domain-containing histidine kinase, partial [Undibacterium sp.]|nr:HAMP domain-containing histidine kinase [Opitutaceae bacterium]